jgi:hypothetical protein
MATIPQFISTDSEARVISQDLLLLLWDSGLSTAIENYIGVGRYASMTVAQLLNSLIRDYGAQYPTLAAALDTHVLKAFLEDMQANGSEVVMSDKLTTGARLPAPQKPTITINSQFVISVYFETPPTKAYVLLLGFAGAVNRTAVFTLSGTDPHIRQIAIPLTALAAGTYRARISAIDSNGLRGFLSPASDEVVKA